MGWNMTKNFFNIIYSYYWVISYILFEGKNKVNRVKRPYICSNLPKMVKMAYFWPQNDVICQNWGEVWQNFFFNIIYFYYRVISYVLFVGKSKVNRVKRPYICSNWPKMAKMASFWPQNDFICRNWGEVRQKFFFQNNPLLLLSHLIYTFLG